MKGAALAIAALTLSVQPLADGDSIEPSVQNEIEHALDKAPPDAPEVDEELAFSDPLKTNGLDKASIAVKLVSSQRYDGRWFAGTNDVTRLAVEILEGQ